VDAGVDACVGTAAAAAVQPSAARRPAAPPPLRSATDLATS